MAATPRRGKDCNEELEGEDTGDDADEIDDGGGNERAKRVGGRVQRKAPRPHSASFLDVEDAPCPRSWQRVLVVSLGESRYSTGTALRRTLGTFRTFRIA